MSTFPSSHPPEPDGGENSNITNERPPDSLPNGHITSPSSTSDLFDIDLSSLHNRIEQLKSDLSADLRTLIDESMKISESSSNDDRPLPPSAARTLFEFEQEVLESAVTLQTIPMETIREGAVRHREQMESLTSPTVVSTLKSRKLKELKEWEDYIHSKYLDEYENIRREVNERRRQRKEGDQRWIHMMNDSFSSIEMMMRGLIMWERKVMKVLFGEDQRGFFLEEKKEERTKGKEKGKTVDGVTMLSSLSASHLPRLIRIKIHQLRAIKNKLPGGQYIIMVTLYDRLGGFPLRWVKLPSVKPTVKKNKKGPMKKADGSNEAESEDAIDYNSQFKYFGSTQHPQRHSGKFYDMSIYFNQFNNYIYIVIPSQQEVKLSQVIMVELIRVRSNYVGEMDMKPSSTLSSSSSQHGGQGGPLLTKYRNLLAQSMVKSSSGAHFLRFAEQVIGWGCFPLWDLHSNPNEGKFKFPLLRGEIRPLIDKFNVFHNRIMSNIDYWLCNCYMEIDEIEILYRYRSAPQVNNTSGTPKKKWNLWGAGGAGSESSKHTLSGLNIDLSGSHSRRSRRHHRREEGDGDNLIIENSGSANPADNGKIGAAARRMKSDNVDDIIREAKLGGSLPSKSVPLKKPLSSSDLRTFKFSLLHVESDVPAHSPLVEKILFLYSEITADLGIYRIFTMDFVLFIFMFVLTWWLRIYIHYGGQYYFISQILEINTYAFNLLPYTVHVGYYLNSNVSLYDISLICCSGPITCFIVFIGFLAILYLMLLVGRIGLSDYTLTRFASVRVHNNNIDTHDSTISAVVIPDSIYRFLLLFAFHSALDPLWIIMVDLLSGSDFAYNYNNTQYVYFQLYYILTGSDQIGYAGIILTLLIIVLLLFIGFFLFLYYLLTFHMNQRMMDLFYRYHVEEGSSSSSFSSSIYNYYIPHDFEISIRVLKDILYRSSFYKGAMGTKRMMMVTSYIVRDHLDLKYEEETLHLSIYNVTDNANKGQHKGDGGGDGSGKGVDLMSMMMSRKHKNSTKGSHRGGGRDLTVVSLEESKEASSDELSSISVAKSAQPHRRLLAIYRHFVRDPSGSWIECFDSADSFGALKMKEMEEVWLEEEEKRREDEEGEEEEKLRKEDLEKRMAERHRRGEEEEQERAKRHTEREKVMASVKMKKEEKARMKEKEKEEEEKKTNVGMDEDDNENIGMVLEKSEQDESTPIPPTENIVNETTPLIVNGGNDSGGVASLKGNVSLIPSDETPSALVGQELPKSDDGDPGADK